MEAYDYLDTKIDDEEKHYLHFWMDESGNMSLALTIRLPDGTDQWFLVDSSQSDCDVQYRKNNEGVFEAKTYNRPA